MKIMCLNGWGGKLQDQLLPYLSKEAPDVLCLQEVIHSPATDKLWLEYRDGDHVLAQRSNFFLEVSHALPDHIGFFCPAAQGVLWDGGQSVPSQWGLATFVHKSLPVTGQVQGFVHKDFAPDGYGEHPRSRSAHGVRVYDYIRKRMVSITHMHGLRDLNGKMDTPERNAQAHKLLELCSQLSKSGDEVIICGDFNVEPESETLRVLKAAGFSELVTGRGFGGTRTSHYKKPGKFADYMLVNDACPVTRFQVVSEPEVSDHCPLILEL